MAYKGVIFVLLWDAWSVDTVVYGRLYYGVIDKLRVFGVGMGLSRLGVDLGDLGASRCSLGFLNRP